MKRAMNAEKYKKYHEIFIEGSRVFLPLDIFTGTFEAVTLVVDFESANSKHISILPSTFVSF